MLSRLSLRVYLQRGFGLLLLERAHVYAVEIRLSFDN